MPAAPIKLEYELSREELRAAFHRDRDRFRMTMRTSWHRWLPACLVLWVMYNGWDNQPWWITGLLLLFAVHFLTFPIWMYWVGWTGMSVGLFPTSSLAVVIETDERSLSVRHPGQKYGSRFWWSRLTGIKETDFALELLFDGKDWGEVMIPWKAFADEQQRREFMDLVNSHLPHSASIAT